MLKLPISFPVQEKYQQRNETLEGIEETRGEDGGDVHQDPDPTLLHDIDQGQLGEVEVIAGIMHDEKGEDVEVVELGVGGTRAPLMMYLIYPMSPRERRKMVLYTGTTVKIDVRGRPYPVGAHGFRTMKTTRPAGFTPEEWATLRNAIDVDEEGVIHPKKKDGAGNSKDATPAEVQRSMPRAYIKAMLKERWGGDHWMYNWGIWKNTNKVKNPVEGKLLADLDWVRIIVNPVNGSVLCMRSKRLQDLGASTVMLDEVHGILEKSNHDGGLPGNIDESCAAP